MRIRSLGMRFPTLAASLALAVLAVLALLGLLTSIAAPAHARQAPALTLGPGDVVRVAIWREEEMSGDFQVDDRGILTVPLLGPMRAGNVPWATLRDSLERGYARQLKAPSIVLTPLRRVYVLGDVEKPGTYLVDPTLPLAGAVAMAGGATGLGDLRRVRVVRDGRTIVRDASIESQLLQADVRSNDQIFVDRRGWFDRNSTFIASALISITGIIVTIAAR